MSFRFSSTPLDESALRAGLSDPACGGYAAFEGWVRDHNEGQRVHRLEYEAFEPLAEGGPFMLAVQWHPEAMEAGLPLADRVLDALITATG